MAVVATIVSKEYKVLAIDNNSRYKQYSGDDYIDIINEKGPKIICFSLATVNALSTYRTIKTIKENFPDIVIIAGGLHVGHKYVEALDRGVDYCVRGEADLVILPLVKSIINDSPVKVPPGVSYYNKTSLVDTLIEGGNAPLPEDLDATSVPDYSIYNLAEYLVTPEDRNIIGAMITERGCPFACTFCADEYIRTKVRDRSIPSIIKEISDLYNDYGVTEITIQDADFNMSEDRVVELCEAIVESGLNKKVAFLVQGDSMREISKRIVASMKKANFNTVSIGLERLEPSVQKKIKKRHSMSRIKSNLNNLIEAGFTVNINHLLGFSFDTVELIEKERVLFKDLLDKYVNVVSVAVLMPMPGTEEYLNNPEVDKEWYLDPILYHKSKPLYFSIKGISYDPRYINVNKLDKDVISSIIKSRDYFKAESIRKKSAILFLLYKFSTVISYLSQNLYKYSPRLEHILFSFLRNNIERAHYYFATKWQFRNGSLEQR